MTSKLLVVPPGVRRRALHCRLAIAAQARADSVTDWNLTVAAGRRLPTQPRPRRARGPKGGGAMISKFYRGAKFIDRHSCVELVWMVSYGERVRR